EVDYARAVLRRAGDHGAERGDGAAAARTALSGDGTLHWRHGLSLRQDLRPGGVAARAGQVPRDLVLLELRGLPGAPARSQGPGRGGGGGGGGRTAPTCV